MQKWRMQIFTFRSEDQLVHIEPIASLSGQVRKEGELWKSKHCWVYYYGSNAKKRHLKWWTIPVRPLKNRNGSLSSVLINAIREHGKDKNFVSTMWAKQKWHHFKLTKRKVLHIIRRETYWRHQANLFFTGKYWWVPTRTLKSRSFPIRDKISW